MKSILRSNMPIFPSCAFLSSTTTTTFIQPLVKRIHSVCPNAVRHEPVLGNRRLVMRLAWNTTATEEHTTESPTEALSRLQSTGLTLTDPKDLYWMTDFLKQEFHSKGNANYPMKTICDGELIETEFHCPYQPKVSPHYMRLCNTKDERSLLYSIPPYTTDMRKYNRINCEKFASLVAPNSNYEDTEAVALMYSMMYYLNDQTAHLKLPEDMIQPQLIDELNDNVLQYLGVFLSIFEPRHPEDLERIWDFLDFYQKYFNKVDGKIILDEKYKGPVPPQIALINKITQYISKRFAPTKNITQFIYEVIRYIKGIKQEVYIRCDKSFTLSLKEYDEFRDQVTSSPMAHAVTDMTYDNFSYKLYLNPLFTELENLTSELITYFNDVCTCDRERLDNDPFNSVFILKDLYGGTYEQSCDLVVRETRKKFSKFLEIKQHLLDGAADETEKQAIAQMIKTREDSLIGYVIHEICCVTNGYARDHKPLMKDYLEKNLFARLAAQK